MTKTTLIGIVAALALVAATYVLFQNQNEEMQPIVDQPCPAGTERVGEGCMSLREACELGGDQYHFDEVQQKCVNENA